MSDAYCSECREELPAPAAPVRVERPMTATDAAWIFFSVTQGGIVLAFFGAVFVWILMSFIDRLQMK